MTLYTIGTLPELEECGPCAVVTGTVEEIRALAGLLYCDVRIVAAADAEEARAILAEWDARYYPRSASERIKALLERVAGGGR